MNRMTASAHCHYYSLCLFHQQEAHLGNAILAHWGECFRVDQENAEKGPDAEFLPRGEYLQPGLRSGPMEREHEE